MIKEEAICTLAVASVDQNALQLSGLWSVRSSNSVHELFNQLMNQQKMVTIMKVDYCF